MNEDTVDYDRIWSHAAALPWCGLIATGRAGSDAFQSQLDSHPQIFGFNGTFFFHAFWDDAVTTRNEQDLNGADIIEEFIGAFIHKFRSKYDVLERKDRLGENMDQSISIDLPVFKSHMLGLLGDREITSRNFIIAVYVAWALSVGQDTLSKRVFFHHIHHVRRLNPFLRDFPDAKIIATTRDPRAAYVSYVEHNGRYSPGSDTPALPLMVLERIVDEPERMAMLGERFRVIRMEDLASEPVLTRVSEWLGIDFDRCMMKSTWNGLRWWGDRMSQVNAQPGMDEQEFLRRIRTNQWENKLHAVEKFILEFILKDRLDWCGYPRARRPLFLHAVGSFFAIPLPMTYELKFLSPRYLWKCIAAGRILDVARIPYHQFRRIAYYYELYFRVLRGRRYDLPFFGSELVQEASRDRLLATLTT